MIEFAGKLVRWKKKHLILEIYQKSTNLMTTELEVSI